MQLRADHSPLTRACRGSAEGVLPYEAFSPLDIQQIVYAILADEQIWQLEREEGISFSYSVAHLAMFDVHITLSKSAVEANFVVAQS